MKKRENSLRPKKIFNKLLLTSSITIIATVSILIIMITTYYSDVIIQREIDMTTNSLERANDYFIEKEKAVTRMIRDLYGDTDLVNDLAYALHNSYEEYFKYRLNQYVDSPDFAPSNFNAFFNSFFYHDHEVVAFTLSSDVSSSMAYEFIYNYNHWNSFIRENITEDAASCKLSDIQFENTFMIHRTINNPGTFTKMGCLTIYYSMEELDHLLTNNRPDNHSKIFLLDENDEMLYTSENQVSKEMLDQLSRSSSDRVSWEGSIYYVNKFLGENDYTYIGTIPKSALNKLTFVKGTMWLFIGFSTIMSIIITYSFMRNYSARIEHINESIHEVEKGNLDIRIRKFKQKDELTTISESFNTMLDELNDYIDRFYVADIRQQEAELKALQSQINPHFLFNTLEVIRMTAVVEGSKTSSKMIYHLSQLFRYTLESKEFVPFHVELEHTNQYLQLMKLHHPDQLKIIVDIPVDIEDIFVQKLILQPIIENYMIHGFQKDKADNYVKITARQIDNKVEISVIDNGLGISKKRLKEVLEHLEDEEDMMQSIGLKNVHQRLQLKYGQNYGLTLQSEEGVKTIVTINIPIEG